MEIKRERKRDYFDIPNIHDEEETFFEPLGLINRLLDRTKFFYRFYHWYLQRF